MSSNKGLLTFLFLFIIVIVIGAAIYYMNDGGAAMMADDGIDTNAYQAVFLNNNQVYFGKLSDLGSPFPKLTDIYYLQVNQVLQPVQGQDGQTSQQQVNDIQLVKLGGELHGPTDEMKLNRDQILLIENLRSDSNVVQAINQFKANQQTNSTGTGENQQPAQ